MTRYTDMILTLRGKPPKPLPGPRGRLIRAPPCTAEDLGLTALQHAPIWRALAHELIHPTNDDLPTRAATWRTT